MRLKRGINKDEVKITGRQFFETNQDYPMDSDDSGECYDDLD